MSELIAGRISCAVLAAVFLAGLVQLAVRLKSVQVDKADRYSYASSRQAERRVLIGGARGRILGRGGEVLADNRTSLSIVCCPEFFQKRTWDDTVAEISNAIERVAAVIGTPSPLTSQALRRHVNQSLAMPIFVWRDIGDDALAVFSEHAADFPGFDIAETEERIYPHGALAAHLLGYVGRDRGDSEAGDEKFNFVSPELRGRAGLEIYYDSFLRGVPGERKLLVDARGFTTRERMVKEPKRGPDLRVSIDIRIQREAERQLQGHRGACAVIDPRNGEVLALASAPGYNPNEFVPTLRQSLYDRYAKDPAKPLFNRASGGAYAPGSTFKPITAMAGLFVGYSPDDDYNCSGVYTLGTLELHCTARWGHGPMDMERALMKSCNPYFCNLGMTVGTNILLRTARQFGLGQKTGIDLGVDMAGTVPDGDWKMRMYNEKWFAGDLAQMSIGQGMLLVSPLQMACVAGAIGTGRMVKPHLNLDVAPQTRALTFSAADLATVRRGMLKVVEGDGESRGTGWRGGEGLAVRVAGKTGTAEVGRGATRRKNTWFIAYAPAEAPQVAVAMVVENGDSGGATTAPKVREVLKTIFGERNDG